MKIWDEKLNQLNLTQLENLFQQIFRNYLYLKELQETYQFAKSAHSQQPREDSNIPYIVHPLRIIIRLYQTLHIKKLSTLQAALLHDTVEDTAVTLQQITSKYGSKVAALVEQLTRVRPDFESPQEKYLSKVRKMAKVMQASREVRILKTMDIIDNMQDWITYSSESKLAKKFPRWLTEVETIYLPLAKTLGEEYIKPMQKIVAKVNKMGYHANPNWQL